MVKKTRVEHLKPAQKGTSYEGVLYAYALGSSLLYKYHTGIQYFIPMIAINEVLFNVSAAD